MQEPKSKASFQLFRPLLSVGGALVGLP